MSEGASFGWAAARPRATVTGGEGHAVAQPAGMSHAMAADGARRGVTRGGRLSDAALVRAAQRGSERAVAELFDRHWSGAYKAAYLVTGDRAAAEDIAQEAFLAALRALPSFDLRRPLKPWLHRIVVNRAIDWARSRALRREVAAEAAGETASPPQPPDPQIGAEVMSALMALAPEQRAVVALRYVLDLTPGEIGRLLGLPRGTVNSRLRRGLDALGDALQPQRDADPPGGVSG